MSCSQSGHDWQEDFCQIWLQPKYESKLKKYPLYFWLSTLNKVEKSGIFFQNLVEFWLLEISQKAHASSILNLLYSFLTVYIYIASKRKAGTSDQHFSKE